MKLNLIIALLLIIPLASGELIINKHTNDFVLSSPNNEQLKLCTCETRVDTVIVENVGSFRASFTLDIQTDWPGSARLAASSFELEAKEFREIPVYISDSCNAAGEFSYVVHARNSYGRDEYLTRTIRSDSCSALSFEVSGDVTTGLCEPASFDVTVENVGRHAETYRLDVMPEADIPVRDIYLEPDASHTQDVTLQWPCTTYGERDVTLTVTTDKSGQRASADRTVTIRNEYAFSLDLSTRMDACALSTERVPLAVRNDAPVESEFRLSLDAPGFVTFPDGRETTLTLDAGEESTVDVEISPRMEGEHSVTVTASDVRGGTSKTRTADLVVSSCYDAEIEVRTTPEQPLLGPDTDCCGLKTYYVNVRNTAEREQTFQLDVDGPSIFLLEERTVRVQPSQSVNVPLLADLPCSDELYDATVRVWPVGRPELVREASIEVTSLTPRSCHMVQIDDDELTVERGADVVPVTVRHTGLQGGLYSITTNGSFTFAQDRIDLRPGDEMTVYMTPPADLEEGRTLVFPTLTFLEQNIQYNEFMGVEIEGPSLWQRFLTWLGSLGEWQGCAGWVLFLFTVWLLMLLILLLVWTGAITPFPEGIRPGTLGLTRTLLVIGMLLLLVTFLLLPAPSRETRFQAIAEGNATVLEWYEGETLTLDLDEYFEDPDMDELTYETTQPRDVQADIEGSMLTLTPDEGFTGENEFVLTASDGEDYTDSPTFVLRVIPERELSLAAWAGVWCKHLIVLELLFMLMTLFLFVLGIRERRQDLKSGNVVVVAPKDDTRKYYASKTGKKAHTRGCRAMRNVKQKDRITYYSKKEALRDGRTLCSLCKDGVSSSSKKSGKTSSKKSTRKKSTGKSKRKRSSRKKSKSKKPSKTRSRKKSTRKKSRKKRKKKSSKKKSRKKSKKSSKKSPKRSKKSSGTAKGKSKGTSKKTSKKGEVVPSEKDSGQKNVNIQVNIKQD